MPRYIVTTFSSHIMKYAIEAESREAVLLAFKNSEDVWEAEISQKHLSENVGDIREATDEEIVAEADEYIKAFVLDRVYVMPEAVDDVPYCPLDYFDPSP